MAFAGGVKPRFEREGRGWRMKRRNRMIKREESMCGSCEKESIDCDNFCGCEKHCENILNQTFFPLWFLDEFIFV